MDSIFSTHDIKCAPFLFDYALGGEWSTLPVRSDRNVVIGDLLLIREYDGAGQGYTGRILVRKCLNIFDGYHPRGDVLNADFVIVTFSSFCECACRAE